MALSHTIITVMEITHKRREQYSVLWPQETFVMGVCNMKDDIIATMATLTSTVTWFVDLNSPVKVTDDDEVLDPRANGLHTMLMMSVTELSTAVGLFPVYIAIALENSFQCQYSNLMVVVEQNRQIIAGPDTTGFDLTITNWKHESVPVRWPACVCWNFHVVEWRTLPKVQTRTVRRWLPNQCFHLSWTSPCRLSLIQS